MNSGNDTSDEHPLVQEVNRLTRDIQHLLAQADQARVQLRDLERMCAYYTQQIALLMANQLEPLWREINSREDELRELIPHLRQLITNSTR